MSTTAASSPLPLSSSPSKEMVLEIQLNTLINEFFFSTVNADHGHEHCKEGHEAGPPHVKAHLTRSFSESMFCLAISEDVGSEKGGNNKQGLSRLGSFPCKKESYGGSEGKPSCKKPPRPPKTQNSSSSSSSDTILLMRTSSYSSSYSSSSSSSPSFPSSSSSSSSSFSPRRRRMRSSSSSSSSSSDSSSSSMWALIFTLLFATIIIGQDLWSNIHHQTLTMQASHGGVANLGISSNTPSSTLDTGSTQSFFDSRKILESLDRRQSSDTTSSTFASTQSVFDNPVEI